MPTLIDKSKFPPEIILDVLELARECITLSREGKNLKTAFLISPANLSCTLLEESELTIPQLPITLCKKEISKLYGLVEGQLLLFEFSSAGTIRGVRKLSPSVKSFDNTEDAFCDITEQLDTVVIHAKGNENVIEIFYQGKMIAEEVFVKKVGRTVLRNLSEITGDLESVLKENHISESVFSWVMVACVRMSHHGRGTTFTIGKADGVLQLSSSLLTFMQNEIKINTNVTVLTTEEVLNYAKEDGAIILDCEGNIKRICAHLNPTGTKKGEVKTGSGTRHESASNISAETGAVAVVVSQDGLITIYNEGKVIIEF